MDVTAMRENRSSWVPWVLLAIGVASVSISAILIRYATDAEPLAISFWRCFAGAGALLPFARSGLTSMPTTGFRISVVAGVFLALHFGTWITSLELTTIAASVLLVTTGPIWVATAAWLLLKERITPVVWAGIGLTLLGAALVAGGDFGGSSIEGNLLALIGGATAGWYVLAGQQARRDVGIIEYAVVTYSVAGVLIAIACWIAGTPLWGYSGQTWLAIAAVVIGPQLLGHTVINKVLKDIDATTVSVVIMIEPIIATFLAYALFDEIPTWLVYPGGAAILAGIYLVTTKRKAEPVDVPL